MWLEPGVPVIAIRVGGSDTWDANTGEPALPGTELDFMNALLKNSGTTVDVTDPDGNVTTFKDE